VGVGQITTERRVARTVGAGASEQAVGWGRLDLFLLVMCMGLVAGASIIFAAQQHLWLDETTQLSGISLGPVGVTRWLAGEWHDFGTPTAPDRSPPLSYWVHWLWGQIFGGSQWSLRMAGVTMVTAACAVMFATARREWGRWWACAATLVMGLSAAIVEKAPEIRPYPLYLLASVIVYAALLGYVRRSSRGRLAGLCAALVMVLYTHFLGVVFTAAVFGALGAMHLRFKRPLRRLFVAAGVVGVFALGLIPFVMQSGHDQWSLMNRVFALAELLWILAGQHVVTFWIPLVPLGVLTAAAMAAAAFAGARRLGPAGFVVLMVMVLGLGAVGVATFVTGAFKPALFQYNLWLIPARGLLFVALVQVGKGWSRTLGRAALVLLLANVVISCVALDVFAARVAHGPDPKILAEIRALGPGQIAMVHERGSGDTMVQLYFNMHYEFGNQFPQITWNGSLFYDKDTGLAVPPVVDLERRYVVVIHSGEALPWIEQAGGTTPVPGGAVEALSASPKWRLVRQYTVRGAMRNEVWVFERSGE